jgi:hypothetical protein
MDEERFKELWEEAQKICHSEGRPSISDWEEMCHHWDSLNIPFVKSCADSEDPDEQALFNTAWTLFCEGYKFGFKQGLTLGQKEL